MNILVIGGGGREQALAAKLALRPIVSRVFAAPGNPGIAEVVQCVPLPVTTPDDCLAVARQHDIDLTIVGPQVPLVDGILAAFRAAGLSILPLRRYTPDILIAP